jgi:hypothetical protein
MRSMPIPAPEQAGNPPHMHIPWSGSTWAKLLSSDTSSEDFGGSDGTRNRDLLIQRLHQTNLKVIAYVAGCEIDTLDLSAGMSTTRVSQIGVGAIGRTKEWDEAEALPLLRRLFLRNKPIHEIPSSVRTALKSKSSLVLKEICIIFLSNTVFPWRYCKKYGTLFLQLDFPYARPGPKPQVCNFGPHEQSGF